MQLAQPDARGSVVRTVAVGQRIERERQRARGIGAPCEHERERPQLAAQAGLGGDRAQQRGLVVDRDLVADRERSRSAARRRTDERVPLEDEVPSGIAPYLQVGVRGPLRRGVECLARAVQVGVERHRPVGTLRDQRLQAGARARQPDLVDQRLQVLALGGARRRPQHVEPAEPGLLQQRRALLAQLRAVARVGRQRADGCQRSEPAVEGGDLGAARMAQDGLVESACARGGGLGAGLAEPVPAGEALVQRRIVGQRELAQRTVQSLAHLVCGEPREGHRQHLVGLAALDQRTHDPGHQQRRLAAARAGIDHDAGGRIDGRKPEDIGADRAPVDLETLARRVHDQWPLRHSPRLAQCPHSTPEACSGSPSWMRASSTGNRERQPASTLAAGCDSGTQVTASRRSDR